MKNNVVLIFFLFLLNSCSPSQKYIGKYYCFNIKGAENYLIIKKDNHYIHYFKKDSVVLSQEGRWEFLTDGFERIELIDFNNYNEKGANFIMIKNHILIKQGDYLNNGFDGNTYSSFKLSNSNNTN